MKKNKLILTGTLFASAFAIAGLASCNPSQQTTNSGAPTTTTTTQAAPTTTTTTTQEEEITGNVIYVSADADLRNGAGTKDNPYRFDFAYKQATPGTTILMKEGTYSYNYRLEIGKDVLDNAEKETGRPGKYITVRPEVKGTKVVFDFSQMNFSSTNRGIQIYSDFWHFKDIEITGAGDNGMYIAGSHNIIENCQFYNNRDTGLQIGRAYSEDNTIDLWPSYNLIKNCTSFDNYDDETYGENADGYAAKLTVGYGNVFDGCIAFRNSDDGWDLFAKVDSGDIGTVVLYNCVSFENGFLSYKNDYRDDPKYGTYDTLNGDGIGFKLGGSTMKGNVIVENCLAFNNKLHGVGDNSNPGVISVRNFTAFNNCANVNEDGTISSERGLPDIANKSNNIDLARSTNSYNNYYGIVSYVNNQKHFSPEGDSEYNQDMFRGSTAYSIFNTGYNNGEIYRSFTGYEDASSWHTDTVDTAYSYGTLYDDMNDEIFADLTAINATCESRADLSSLLSIHTTYRNSDNSVNMHDKVRITDQKLLTYANGNPIGAQLSKNSMNDYTHYSMYTFESGKEYNSDELRVLSAYSICEVVANTEAVFQNFILPKQIASADVYWESENTDVIEIDNTELLSKSDSVFSTGVVHVPDTTTNVKLKATISSNQTKVVKEFNVTVMGRNQYLGELVSNGSSAIRVNLYGTYAEPHVYALDASAITISEFPQSLYDLENTYRYATDRKSKFYAVDGVYTSVAGVYEVTATATLKSNPAVQSKLVYRVYVVDPDSNIDFTEEPTISLSSNGFDITGDLSNIEGSVIAITSPTPINNLTTARQLLEHTDGEGLSDVQKVKIVTDTIVASFNADNATEYAGNTQYYIYYAVVNGNESANTDNNPVYTKEINVVNVSTKEDFFNLARFGKIGSEPAATTIYSLTQDLDFEGEDWDIKETIGQAKIGNFTGLFRGNKHTIKNIYANGYTAKAVTATSFAQDVKNGIYVLEKEKYKKVADDSEFSSETTYYAKKSGISNKSINIFYKVSNGTIMDVKFSNIKLIGADDTKQIGIVGELQGGYLDLVIAENIYAAGKESVGGIVGQVTGGNNYVTRCAFINPIPEVASKEANQDKEATEDIVTPINDANTYKITVSNKYAGGIIGNAQMNNDQTDINLTIYQCYAEGIIGDGTDAAGNMGLILGRVKNDNDVYDVSIKQCVAKGLVISKGQYTAGIVGDFDNGSGHATITNNFADITFIYQGKYLNAEVEITKDLDCQKYAHKNSNPIVGRAVSNSGNGEYITSRNMGSWTEYYGDIISISMVFDSSDTEDGLVLYVLNKRDLEVTLQFDFENDFVFENGTVLPKWLF